MITKTRIHKKDLEEKIDNFLIKYCTVLFIISITFALSVFVAACFACVPPTESGTFYNHL